MWGSRLVLALIILGAAYLLYSLVVGLASCSKGKSTSRNAAATPLISEVKERDMDVEKAIKLSSDLADRIARHSNLPDRSPLGMGWLSESQASNKVTMAQLTETLAIELGSSKILGTLRTLRENQERTDELAARTQSSNPGIASSARAEYAACIKQNDALLSEIRNLLDQEGMPFSESEVRSLCVSPNAEDTVILISAFGSLKKISQKMEDRLRNFPSLVEAQRYYGAYSALLIALDKIQEEGIWRIEKDHIPHAQSIAEETESTMMEAQKLLSQRATASAPSAAEARALQNNIGTCRRTIQIAERTQQKLRQNLAILQKANKRLATSIEAAENSHKTVMLQKEIVALEETHLREIADLQALTIPELAAVNFADPEHPEVSAPTGRVIEATVTY